MNHCHFSILYNELPFLKQKLPFLYENYQQLIFFDLGIFEEENLFSSDGSHEFIKNYPDPENKITLIEKTNLDDVFNFTGSVAIGKQKMFAVGSQYVRDDIDIFWCTDMDEFFNQSLIRKVENVFSNNREVRSIDLRHLCFWKNFSYTLSTPEEDVMTLYARIARHTPGNIYSHCAIQEQFKETYFFDPEDEVYYHFAWVGDSRVRRKIRYYTEPPTGNPGNKGMYNHYIEQIWEKFDSNLMLDPHTLYGYPWMHPNFIGLKMGIKRFDKATLPRYIDSETLLADLEK